MNLLFIFNSIALGVGLAMDAFSVSLANGLREPGMNVKRMFLIAGTFAFFQTMMPLIGWVCVHTVVTYFSMFEKAIPWIALGLLGYIGGSMLKEGFSPDEEEELTQVGGGTLVMQGIATSIDALSVGFTIAEYDFLHALSASLIIGAVTLAICLAGLKIGRQFGMKLAGKASILGGVILIAIGLEIFITGIF
ncbi:MAG: manganese efflux pump MntP family protein [Erysipelotrichaceae bacterium]|jgi:putative Mn2+ efflux pump MntP|nr:manganese efflux pump MntP family protein [Erysipelotrichaceae bacterium]